jgi:2-oxoglutarate/2-oxoacid ferredoxin oxidoreductase subunit alpha
MEKQEVTIKVGGEAGFGIKVSGLILGKTLFNAGFKVFGYSEYPSLIRGGHNLYQLNISGKNVYSATKKIDILVALNMETVELHESELNSGGFLIYDGLKLNKKDFKDINLIDIPLTDYAENAGHILTRNVVSLGAVMYALGLDLKLFNQALAHEFGSKGDKVVKMNEKAARAGYEHIQKSKITNFGLKPLNEKNLDNSYIMTANEATAYGMIQAGCKLYSAYPMTPATSIMHVLAQKSREQDLVVHQTEDEISAIGAAIGAATTGVRAATGTSGGGFALMVENLGLAAMTETPLVIIESQRTAPATGLPTWTEQGDLQFMIRASHGEFPRYVIAPGDAEEAFYMIQEGFNLAEKYQVPVIFLLDKLLSESDYIMESIDKDRIKIKREGILEDSEVEKMKDFKRYELTKNGISKRALPGQEGGVHVINSDDHDEHGFSIEDSESRIAMMDKRYKKVEHMLAEIPEPKLYGPKNADLTVVGWGSVKGAVVDGLDGVGEGEKVNFLHIAYVWPFPTKRVKKVLEGAKNILLVENNKTGQLGDLIRQETGIEIKNKFLKYDGRPFFREEVVEEINKYI